LAPAHLPREIRREIPDAKILSVLQNIDALYWRAAGERTDKIEAVRVNEDVLCAFNATPLEKYESYRLFLDQWSRCEDSPDFAPTIYNLIDSLTSFLEINRYSPHNGTQPKFLVDMLPEVYAGSSDAMLRRLLSRKGISDQDRESMLCSVADRGSAYLPQVNAFYIREFQMMQASEDATRFLHQACQGLPMRLNGHSPDEEFTGVTRSGNAEIDRFYARVIEHAVAYFGSRVLYPSRPVLDAEDFAQLSRAACEKAARAAVQNGAARFESTTLSWGYRIGSQIYDAYLAGKVTSSGLRRLFLAHLNEPGMARKVCATVISKLRAISRLQARAVHA
jgi:hypothetical protein